MNAKKRDELSRLEWITFDEGIGYGGFKDRQALLRFLSREGVKRTAKGSGWINRHDFDRALGRVA